MKEYVFMNGSFMNAADAHISVNDLGLLRGYGIFDFFRAIDGKPIFLEDHLARFQASATLMNLEIPVTIDQLRQIINDIIKLTDQPLLGVKVILTGGESLDGYTPASQSMLLVTCKPFSFKDATMGMKLMTLDHQRDIPTIKTLNYIVPIRAIPAMKAMNADDVLYHSNGFITELSRSNIFIIKNQTLITPATGILYGVTRKHVLAIAKQQMAVEERNISLEEFWQADEVFTTGSTKRIIAITQVDNQAFSTGKIGKTTQALQDIFLSYEKSMS
jgi:branched-chain amino acid aminotransferase